MRLTKLGVENFKCFSKYQEIDLGRITLLTGANSSGKSSLMAAILVAMQSEMFPEEFVTNGELIELGSYYELVNNNDTNKDIKFQYEFLKRIHFNQILSTSKNSNVFIKSLKLDDKDINLFTRDELLLKVAKLLERMNQITDKQGKSQITDEIKNYKEKTLSHFEDYANKKTLVGIGNNIFRFLLLNFTYIGSFRQPPSRGFLRTNAQNPKVEKDGSGYLEQLIKWQDDNAPQLEKLIKQLESLELAYHIETPHLGGGRYDLQVKTSKDGKAASLADVGFGISQFLPIMVADNQMSDSSTLIVSQPEIHLHPSIQSKFGEYLTNQVNSTEKSYIIETHSEYLLNRIRLAIVKGELKEEDVKVYYLENNTTDVEIHQLELTKTGKINNAPANFFETYMVDSMEIMLNAME